MYAQQATYSRRQRTHQAMAAFALAVLLVFVALSATVQVARADVSLSARIRPSVVATFTTEGVVIRANTPWQVELENVAGHNEARTLFTGGATPVGGTLVPVGLDGSVVSVVAQ